MQYGKKLAILVLAIMLVCFTACSRKISIDTTEADKSTTIVETEEEVEFLNFLAESSEEKDSLTTTQGVTFSCSSPYNMWAETTSYYNGNVVAFCLKQEYVKENYYSDDEMEVEFELSSNAKITGILYLDYQKEIIGAKKVSGKVIAIPEKYKDRYIDKIVIFIEHSGKTYQTMFERTGA